MVSVTKLNGSYWIVPPKRTVNCNLVRPVIQTAYFRTNSDLPAGSTMTLAISASSRYRLWINGKAVASGPLKGDRWRHYYETIDVSEYLREGLNVFAVKVTSYPVCESVTPGEGGPLSVHANAAGTALIVAGQCVDPKGRIVADLATGKALWMAMADTAVNWRYSELTFWMGAMEDVDGALLPHGWREDKMPSGNWHAAVSTGQPADGRPYGIIPAMPLQERSIPLLFERRREFVREMPLGTREETRFQFTQGPTRIPPFSRQSIELDAGELTTGYFRLRMSGGQDGRIRIGYAECYSTPSTDGAPLKAVRDDCAHYDFYGHEDIYTSGGGEDQLYEPFWFRTFRFVRLEVETQEEALLLYEPDYLETGYPLNVKAKLTSSSPWIKPLWDISVRTLQRCMHETYGDGPYYEQLQYALDTRLEALFTYMISGDTRLGLKAIEDFHASLLPEGITQARYPSIQPQVIPSFSLYWIMMVNDYYEYTGDTTVPKRYRPTMDAILDWYDRKIGSSGLVEGLGYWEFVDWVQEWRESKLHPGVPNAAWSGPSTVQNLIYASTLQTAARLMRDTGRKETAIEYEERSNRILDAVERHCWSSEDGLYREGPTCTEFSQHSQIWAVLSGLATGVKAESILRKALNDKVPMARISYVMNHYLFRALEVAGLYELSESRWDLWRKLLPLNITTWPEEPDRPRSDCHAWSAMPLLEFTQCLLGVKPLAPGWETIGVQPHFLNLEDMSGMVPTPKGNVSVEWTKGMEQFELRVVAPVGVPTKITLPDGTVHMLESGGEFAC